MIVPIRPETTHFVGRVCDNHPSVGKWETLIEEGDVGVCGVEILGIVGSGVRDRVVRRIIMECCGWRSEMMRRGSGINGSLVVGSLRRYQKTCCFLECGKEW
jgi:hypothetical protein